MSRHNSKGTTLTDVVIALFIGVILTAALLPAAGILDEARNKAACARNLKEIAAALITYSNANTGHYPRTYFDRENPEKVTAYSNWKAKDPFAADGVAANDVTADLYLLVRGANLDPAMLVCPATNAKPLVFGKGKNAIAEKATDVSNFPSGDSLSYSGSCPYCGAKAVTTQWVWDATLGSDYPLVCDMNPGGDAVLKATTKSTPEQLRKANSPNHGGSGQNVLYGDYHVEFQKTPFCGVPDGDPKTAPRDNIFARSTIYHDGNNEVKIVLKGDPIMGPPCDSNDNVMLPIVGYKPAAAVPAAKAK